MWALPAGGEISWTWCTQTSKRHTRQFPARPPSYYYKHTDHCWYAPGQYIGPPESVQKEPPQPYKTALTTQMNMFGEAAIYDQHTCVEEYTNSLSIWNPSPHAPTRSCGTRLRSVACLDNVTAPLDQGNPFCDARDTRWMWHGIKTLTDYKTTPQGNNSDTHLSDTVLPSIGKHFNINALLGLTLSFEWVFWPVRVTIVQSGISSHTVV